MSLAFAPLPDSRVDESFALLRRVGAWIRSQGRRQRIGSISEATYQQWQAERANYVVLDGTQIVGLLTLRRETLEQWPHFAELGSVWMLRALATDPQHRQRGIGKYAVTEALKRHGGTESTYLDCVSEFLPDYYRQLGFEPLDRQRRVDPDGEIYDITLMCHAPRSLPVITAEAT